MLPLRSDSPENRRMGARLPEPSSLVPREATTAPEDRHPRRPAIWTRGTNGPLRGGATSRSLGSLESRQSARGLARIGTIRAAARFRSLAVFPGCWVLPLPEKSPGGDSRACAEGSRVAEWPGCGLTPFCTRDTTRPHACRFACARMGPCCVQDWGRGAGPSRPWHSSVAPGFPRA